MLRAQPWPGARSTWSCETTLRESWQRKHGTMRMTTHAAAAPIFCQRMAPALRAGAKVISCFSRTSGRAAGNRVIDHKQHCSSHDRDKHAVEIEAGDAGCAERSEEIAAHHGADDAEHNIH